MPQAVAAAGEQQVTAAGAQQVVAVGEQQAAEAVVAALGAWARLRVRGGGGLQNAQVWSLARGLNHKSDTGRRIFI
jgi:hypothetical protein